MTDEKLLNLYRKKRTVDGLNGRTWDATNHLKYDKKIELEESCYLTNRPSRAAEAGEGCHEEFGHLENCI